MNAAVAMNTILDHVADGQDLTPEMARACFDHLFSGHCPPAQAGGLLLALRAKGETGLELAAAVQAALQQARTVSGLTRPRIDTCGTGGDNKSSFNCSTVVALYLADMGYDVVKHGNRAVSSSCGSADVVEALGLPFAEQENDVHSGLARSRFVFLFAPHFHPAFAKLEPIRKDLGVRTLFNLLGPLLNPARPTHQLLGVPRSQFMQPVADALTLSGIQRAAVVHGAGGYDELTPLGPNRCLVVDNGEVVRRDIDPAAFGIATCDEAALACRDKTEALEVVRALLQGRGPQAMQGMLALNLGVALFLLEPELSLDAAVARACEAVSRGISKEVACA